MRLKNYINEKVATYDKEEQLFFELKLKRNCSEYIEIVKDKRFLWRASRDDVVFGKEIIPRTNRRPTDMPLNFHLILDKMFHRKFGWGARSEGVFATSNHDSTIMYGRPYYFWPFNGYKYVWNNKIPDLYNYVDINFHDVSNADFAHNIFDVIQEYRDTDLYRALETGVEISFKCKAYYLTTKSYVDFIR